MNAMVHSLAAGKAGFNALSSLFFSSSTIRSFAVLRVLIFGAAFQLFYVSADAQTCSKTFNSTTTWTVPAGVTSITVKAWGGGGAGGGVSAASFAARGAAGGGGGAFSTKTFSVTPGETINLVVGSGGTGSSAANGGNGVSSTVTYNSVVEVAANGGLGGGAHTGTVPSGGAGGTGGVGTITAGGNGGDGSSDDSGAGGKGGTADGGNGGVSVTGGTNNGNSGSAPGGGGSGARTNQTFLSNGGNRSGGAGASGRIIIEYAVEVTCPSDMSVCLNDAPITLSGESPSGGTYSGTGVSGGVFTPSTAGVGVKSITYSLTNADGCTATCSFNITVSDGSITETFNSSTSWIAPTGVTSVTVQAWGGGGGGGVRTDGGGVDAGGGGGGAYASSVITVVPGQSYTITVGAGGAAGQAGSASTFGANQVRAAGGTNGSNNNTNGGAGGTVAASIGTTRFAGGNGGTAIISGAEAGAGGGGSAFTNANGNNAANVTNSTGTAGGTGTGNGGRGGDLDGSPDAEAGAAPGGGGGGRGQDGGTSKAGAVGRIVLTYTVAATVSTTTSTICAGESVTLTAAGPTGATYSWNTVPTTSSTSITVTPTTTTTYVVTVTSADGCNSSTASQTITVNPKPSITFAPVAPEVCSGSSVTVTATATDATFVWSTGATTSDITVSPTSNQTYTVTATTSAGCVSSSTVTVSVNDLPTVSITTDPDVSTICTGESITLDAGMPTRGLVPELEYDWSTGDITSSITVTPLTATTTTYTVTVTDENGCTNTASFELTVNQTPTVSITTATDYELCPGEDITLDADGADAYVWSTLETTASITVSPTASSTVYTVTGTTNGCSATVSQTVIRYIYESVQDGDYDDENTWAGKCLPPNPIPVGVTVIIKHKVTIPVDYTLTVNGTLEQQGNDADLDNQGMVMGTGTLVGDFLNPVGGTYSPGSSPGCLAVTGNFDNEGTLDIDIWGETACSLYDQVNATGTSTVSGTVNITVSSTYTPGTCTAFTIVTGSTVTYSGTLNVTDGYKAYAVVEGGNSLVVYLITEPEIEYSAETFECDSDLATVSQTGATGGTYTASPSGLDIDASTGAVTVSSSTIGVYTITYTVSATTNCTDALVTSTTFTIEDTTAPTVSCTTSTTITTNPSTQCSALFNIPSALASDNCTVTPTLTVTVDGFPTTIGALVTLPKGVNNIVYTATDDEGNEGSCTLVVTVNDDDAPILVCPVNITVNSSGGQDGILDDCGATVSWSTLVASDNCPGVFVQPTDDTYTNVVADPINTFFSVGTTPIYYRATDAAGNTSTCTFTVTVNDNETPEFVLPVPTVTTKTVSCPQDAEIADVPVDFVIPMVMDNCGTITPTVTVTTSPIPCEGDVVIRYTWTDTGNNSITFDYTYTIDRTGDPSEFGGPVAISSTVACIVDAVTPTTLPTVSSTCGEALTPTGPVEGGTYVDCEGTKTYTYTYQDCTGAEFVWTYTYTIEVEDFTIVTPTGEQTVSCIEDIVVPTPPVVYDNCGNLLTPVGPTEGGDLVDCEGDKTYTWTYTDCELNTHDYVFTYTVDRTGNPTEFGGPVAVSSTVACISDAVAPTTLPTVSSTCGETLTPTAGSPEIVDTPASLTCEGSRDYIYTYEDCTGAQFVWTYTYTIEAEDFTITTPTASSTVECIADATEPTPPTVVDNCGNEITPTGPVETGTYVDCEGTKIYTWTYTDCEGNVQNYVYTYTVSRTTAPVQVGGPVETSSTVECLDDAGAPTLPNVEDVCGNTIPAPTPGIVDTPASITCEGSRVYTYTYADCAGLEYVWTYTYTIDRTTLPSDVADTPVSSTVECFDDAVPPVLPVVEDVCGNVLTPDQILTPGSMTVPFTTSGTWTVPPGITSVTVTAWGGGGAGGGSTPAGIGTARGGAGGGGGAYATKVISVTPGQVLNVVVGTGGVAVSGVAGGNGGASTITGFSGLINAPGGAGGAGNTAGGSPTGGAGATGAIGDATGNGVSGGNGATGNGISSGAGGAGASPGGGAGGLQLTSAGNEGDGNPGTGPGGAGGGSRTSSISTNINRAGGNGADGYVTISYATPQNFVDNETIADCEGTRVYTYTYTDCANQIYTWNYTYTVERSTPPAIVTPTTVSATTVECVENAVLPTAPKFEDVCGNILSPDNASPTPVDVITDCEGTRTYTFTYTDCASLQSTWTYTYTIDDTSNPVASCDASYTVTLDSNGEYTLSQGEIDDLNNGSTDNCVTSTSVGQLSFSIDDDFFDCDDSGTGVAGNNIVTRTLTVSDCAGNSSTCTVAITVLPLDPDANDVDPTNLCSGSDYTYSLQSFIINGVTSTFEWNVDYGDVTGGSYDETVTNTDATITETNMENKTPDNIDVVYTVTPFNAASGCEGTTFTVSQTVYPEPVGSNQEFWVCNPSDWNFDISTYFTNTPTEGVEWSITYTNDIFVEGEYLDGQVTTTTFGNEDIIANGVVNNATQIRTLVYTITPRSFVNKCLGDPFTVTINILPTVTVDAQTDGDLTLCLDETRLINSGVTPDGDYTYEWTVSDPSVGQLVGVTNTTSVTLQGVTPGVVTVTVNVYEANNGCLADTDDITFTIFAPPAVVINDIAPVCVDAPVITMTATPAGGVWSGVGVSTGGAFDPAIAGVGNTVLTYNYNLDGCAVVTTTTVVVNDLPSISASSGDDNICVGESTTLEAVGGVSYVWNDPLNSTGGSINVSPLVSTTYSVTGTDVNGCTNVASVTITVNTLPVAPETQGDLVCVSSTVANLTAECTTPGCTINWYTALVGGTQVATNTAVFNPLNGPAVPGTYIYYAECVSAAGCASTRTITTLVVVPGPTVNVQDAGPFCETAAPLNLVASPSGGTWSGVGITDAVFGTFDPALVPLSGTNTSTTTMITYSYDDGNGCTANDFITITVNTDDAPVISNCPTPSPLVKAASPLSCLYTPDWAVPTATDDCQLVTFTNNVAGSYTLGTYTITYIATDSDNNTSTCSFTLEVQDQTSPSIFSCPTSRTIDTNTDECSQTNSWNSPATQDACGLFSWSVSYTADNTFNPVASQVPTGGPLLSPLSQPVTQTFYVGRTIVTYLSTDAAGNTSTCQFTVTVTEDDKPSFAKPDDQNLSTDSGSSCPAVAEVAGVSVGTVAYNQVFTVAGISFNAPVFGTYNSTTPGEFGDACDLDPILTLESITPVLARCTSTITMVWKVTDDFGNFRTQDQVFTIIDNTIPSGSATYTLSNRNECKANALATNPFSPSNAVLGYSDNCGGVVTAVLVTSTVTGTDCGWTVTHTYNVVDECGNTLTNQSYSVTGSDQTAPVINTAATNLTVECDGAGNSDELNSWLANQGGALATDACNTVSWTYSPNPATLSDLCGATGSVTVVFTASDICGNTSTTSAVFTIVDTTSPAVTQAASNETVECDGAGNTSDLNAWLANNGGAVATDVCGSVTWSNNYASLSDLCGATASTTVVFTATDDCGNESTTVATFIIQDTTSPEITLAASNETVECDGAGNTTALNAWLTDNGGATATDVCGNVTWSNNFSSLSDLCGATGAATVVFTATDECGNKSSTTATFTIQDTTVPTVNTDASDLTVECDGAGNTAALNSWLSSKGGAAASDICGGVSWSNNFTGLSDLCGATGSATVIFTATDDCGNISTTAATFTIEDTTAPTVTQTASNQTVECDGSGNTADLTSWLSSNGGAGASDICGSVTWSNNFTSLSDLCGATGTASVVFTATDACGNTSETSAVFTIEDTTVPSITTLASNETVECDGLGNLDELNAWLDNNGGAISSDVCSDVTWSNNFTSVSDLCGATGSATVVFTATDACGLISSTTATFTIQDTSIPVVTGTTYSLSGQNVCYADALATYPFSASNAIIGYGDVCSGDVTASLTNTNLTGTDCGWTITYTYEVTDDCGNSFTGRTYTVSGSDQTAPIFTSPLPANQEYDVTQSDCNLVVPFAKPSSVDNCNTAVVTAAATNQNGGTIVLFDLSTFYQGTFPVGINTVSITTTDICGNKNTHTFTITIFDKIKPVLNCPATITSEQCSITNVPPYANSFAFGLAGGSFSDNCAVATNSFTWIGDVDNGLTCPKTITRTYQVSDIYGNTGTCAQSIVINDTTLPVAPIGGFAPADVTISCTESTIPGVGSPVGDASGVTDNCGSVSYSYSDVSTKSTDPLSCSFYTYGIVRTWSAKDLCDNTITDVQLITVQDIVAPSIAPDAQPLSLDCGDPANEDAIDNWLLTNGGASATDNCSNVTWSNDFTGLSDLCGETGAATVIFTATDVCGNISTTVAIVKIEDTTPPVINTLASDSNVECAGDVANQNALNAWLSSNGGAVATDVCGDVTWTYSPDPALLSDECGRTGSVTVTFVATDECGNASSTTATFTIEDTSNPVVVTGASNPVVECAGSVDNQAAFETWLANNGDAVITDECSDVTWSTIPANPALISDCGLTGSATVTFVATDACGRSSSSTGTFTIVDTQGPSVTAAQNASAECDGAGNVADINAWLASNGGATASDVCGDVTWSNDYVGLSDGCGATGSATVIFTATDECGNASTTAATFTVNDTTAPTVDNEPASVTVECDGAGNVSGLNEWLLTYANYFATDVCGSVSYSYAPVSPTLSNECGATGSVTVTFTATDACNNTVSMDATFTVTDTTAPEFTAEATSPVFECAGVTANQTAFEAWLADNGGAVADDACGNFTWSTIPANPVLSTDECGFTGSAEVTFVATDDCGNVSSSTGIFTIVDTTSPSITNASNGSVVCGTGDVAALNAWLEDNGGATASDVCGNVTWSNDYSGLSDLCGNTGAATVVFTATDDCGNQSSTTATFTIFDNQPPSITTPASNFVTACNSGSGNVIQGWLEINGGASASDNCGNVTWTNNYTGLSDLCGNTGSATVIFTATDDCGNISTTVATITVTDTTAPALTAQAQNQTVQCDGAGNSAALNAWLSSNGGATATDACGDITWSYSPNPAVLSDLCGATGAVTVTFRATDECGNSSTTVATFTVTDTAAPVITTQASNQTVECNGSGNVAQLLNWLNTRGGAAANDVCSGSVTWSYTPNPALLSDQCGATGSVTVSFIATDACGNSSSTTATFTITDTTAPVFTSALPQDQSYNVTESDCNLVVPFNKPSASDVCGTAVVSASAVNISGNPVVVFDLGTQYQATFPTGANTVTLVVTDACGNTSTHSFTVTILDEIDPILTCPPTANTQCSIDDEPAFGNVFEFELGGGVADDNCFVDPSSWTLLSQISDGLSCPETVTRVYKVSDVSGNSATCVHTIIIDDTFAPTSMAVPANVNTSCAADTSPVSTGSATGATDNCTDSSALVYTYSDSSTKSVDPADCDYYNYTITRTWIVTDACGNTASGTQLINVSDNEAPVIAKCDDITVNLDENGNYTITSDDLENTVVRDEYVADNCAGDEYLTRSVSDNTFNCSDLGTSVSVVVTVGDVCNNTSTCTFTVTAIDLVAPTAVCNDITVSLDDMGNYQLNESDKNAIVAGSTDNCTTNLSKEFSDVDFSCSDLNNPVSITVIVTDESLNSTSCTALITVVDEVAPVITCPGDIDVNTDLGECSAVVTFVVGTSDNCSVVTTVQTAGLPSGSAFPKGSTVNTFTATDGSGNESVCSFTVTVTDNEAPQVTCPADAVVNTDAGECSAVYTYDVLFDDNCAGSTIEQTEGFASGQAFPKGITTNKFVVTDASNNTSECSFTVTVEDKEAPTVTCPSDVTIDTDAGECDAVYTYDVLFDDNCSGSIIEQTAGIASGEEFPKGTTTNTFLVTDASNNTAVCSFTVTVEDNEAPVVTCAVNTTRDTDVDKCEYTVVGTEFDASFTDNCPDESITNDYNNSASLDGAVFQKGSTTVVWTVDDGNGQISTCSIIVVIDDNQAPVVTCPSNATRNTDLGVCTYTVVGAELDATFADNCPDVTKSNNFNGQNSLNSAVLPLGTTTVVWTVNDNNGQTATCSFEVTVVDNQGPTMPSVSNTTVTSSPTSCFTSYDFTYGPITDNCTMPDDLDDVVITATLLENGDNVPLVITNLAGGLWRIQSQFGLPVGTNEIEIVATDDNGVTTTLTYTVTVEDVWAPIINCPANITVTAPTGPCVWSVNWNQPVISDFCPGLSVTSTANSGDQFPVGQTTPVTYYATDGSGNISSCTFTVTVNGECIQNPSDLLISYFDAPQAWNLNECLDVIIDMTNVGGQTASGTKQFLLTAMNGWTYNWNPAQTQSETIFGDIVNVQNNAWVAQPVFIGPLFVGIQFSTNQTLNPNQVVNLAIQVCAPSVATSRFLNSSIQAGSGGDSNAGNNLARINVVSQ